MFDSTGSRAGNRAIGPRGSAPISGGFVLAPFNGGVITTGTFTPNPLAGNYQFYTNNGAHNFATPLVDCALDVLVTNGSSAGAISFAAGFSVGINTGDSLTTANGNKFIISVRRINGTSTYVIKALQ